MTPKIIADFETQLATAVSVGSTTFTLSSATDDDGVALPTGLYYFTVDNASTQKEYLAGTLTGAVVTAVVSVSRQGVETSGAVRAHRIGGSVILTDFATYSKYMNSIALVSAPDASTIAKGVVEAATTAEINSGAATGSTGAVIAIAPDKLTASNYGIFLSSMTGVVLPYAGSAAPTGFLLCDGAAVSRTTFATLFALVSTTYGVGDGSTTFNLPDLKGRIPVGRDISQTEFDILAETGGAKTHTLSTAEMPSHTHATDSRLNSPTGSFANIAGSGSVTNSSIASSSTGGGGSHNNLQPYIVLNYIIKT